MSVKLSFYNSNTFKMDFDEPWDWSYSREKK